MHKFRLKKIVISNVIYYLYINYGGRFLLRSELNERNNDIVNFETRFNELFVKFVKFIFPYN